MRYLILAILALLILLFVPSRKEAPVSATIVPDVTMTTLTGERFTLHSLKGRPIFLHFWASWCAPCVEEFPAVLTMARGHPEWIFVLVSADEYPANIAPFIQKIERKTGILLSSLPNVKLVEDPSKHISQQVFQTINYPETILIGPDLSLQNKVVGPIDPSLLLLK